MPDNAVAAFIKNIGFHRQTTGLDLASENRLDRAAKNKARHNIGATRNGTELDIWFDGFIDKGKSIR